MQLKPQRAFSLVEMAVVLAIVGLLLGAGMATLSSINETRDKSETERRLNAAVDALIGFAVVNKRLPCPAVTGATGVEAPSGGGSCTTNFNGYLPAKTLGLLPTDSSGYAVDAYGNRIRYVVASAITGTGCGGTLPHFTSQTNLKANGIACKPNDLDVLCSTVAAGVSATCNQTVHVVDTQTIAFIVYSVGKNGAITADYGADESENTDGDSTFVYRSPSDSGSTLGKFDDLLVVVPAGVLYQKLVSAGALP